MTRDLGEWGQPIRMPHKTSSGGPMAYEVTTVNADGTVDLRNRLSRATRSRVPGLAAGWDPAKGDLVIAVDLGGNPQTPAIVAIQKAASDPLGGRVGTLETEVTALQGAQGPLVSVAFAANWTNRSTAAPDATQAVCGSWIDKSGNVHVQGVAQRTTAAWSGGVAVCTLTAAHWPVKTHGFSCYSVDSASQKAMWRTTVDSSGVVALQDLVGAANGGVGSFVYLDGIFFRLDA